MQYEQVDVLNTVTADRVSPTRPNGDFEFVFVVYGS